MLSPVCNFFETLIYLSCWSVVKPVCSLNVRWCHLEMLKSQSISRHECYGRIRKNVSILCSPSSQIRPENIKTWMRLLLIFSLRDHFHSRMLFWIFIFRIGDICLNCSVANEACRKLSWENCLRLIFDLLYSRALNLFHLIISHHAKTFV